MNSALYECHVFHKRFAPKEHSFAYRIFMFHLDLEELSEVARRVLLFGFNRWNVYSFRERDHLDFGKPTLRENVQTYLAREGVTLPPGHRITLLTLPRVLGYIFNPVSFYFCHAASGEPLCAIAEVGNTFGEMKPFLLREPDAAGHFHLVAPKHFYVSPFSALDLEFEFRLQPPGSRLAMHIDDLEATAEGRRRILTSSLTGQRRPLTSAQLLWLSLKYPFITLKVIGLIHWHALLLWLQRIPWHAKADRRDLQQAVLNPHRSLSQKTP